MYQSLAISPLFFTNIETNNVLNVLDFLNTEIILSDTNKYILDEYIEIIPIISDKYVQLWLKDFQNNITINGGNRIKVLQNIQASKRSRQKLFELKTEIELVKADENWEIILVDSATYLRYKLSNKAINSLGNIKLVSPQKYIRPEENSQILSKEEKIKKDKGDNFDLVKWLNKFIKSAKQIEIHDGYLQSKRAFNNLEKIFATINITDKKMPIQIITMSDKARNTKHNKHTNTFETNHDGNIIDEEIKKLGSKYDLKNLYITLKNDKREISDRKLITDKFHIVLGHSLDAVDYGNYVVKQFDIKVSKV